MKLIFICILSFVTIIKTVYMQSFTTTSEGDSCLIPNNESKKSDKGNLYKGQEAFTISLLKAINKVKPNENLFFSPYSTYHALLLAYFGSANNTEKELKKALHLDWADNKGNVVNAYRVEKRSRDLKDSDIEFISADKIFIGQDTPIRECVKQILEDEIENLNFLEKPDECRRKINNWVGSLTKNEIPEFLRPDDISTQTKIVLANAAYFKGQWETKFDKKNTKRDTFYTGSGKKASVDMMNNKGIYYFAVSHELKCQILELSYREGKRGHVSMMILLPQLVNNESNLQETLEKLTSDILSNVINDLEPREIQLGLPKFTFEKRLELVPILNEIGVNDLFTSRANLQTFSDKNNLAFDDALHVAKIKVDEEGSIAAAATGVFGFRKEIPLGTTEFICNHPFLFLIYDHKSKAILFAGIYSDP